MMKSINHRFYAARKTRQRDLERHLSKQVSNYKKVLRDLHPTARRITHAILERSVDNRTWNVGFYID